MKTKSTETIKQTMYSFECVVCGFPQHVNQNNPFVKCVSCNSFYAVQLIENALCFYDVEMRATYFEDQWEVDYINSPIETGK